MSGGSPKERPMRVRFSARTHVGMRREVNQDSYGSGQPDGATLLVICDGMGGHAAGEVASQLGVETIIATFNPGEAPDQALRDAFTAANERIYREGQGNMGTTGVAALFLQNAVHIANVGDSRAYMVREGQITQISRDHSFVSDQVEAGLMTPEQARASNIRNIITRALGHTSEVEVDVFTVGLLPGDTVLLSSDGMHGLITDDEIAELASMLTLDDAAQRLIDTANERGGHDNITVVIAQVDEIDQEAATPLAAETPTTPLGATPAARTPAASPERPLSRLGALLATLTLLLLLGIGGFVLVGTRAAAPTSTPTGVASSPASPAPSVAPTSAVTASPAPSPTRSSTTTPGATATRAP
jgi:serine/threonine protein phosphatase PrpC